MSNLKIEKWYRFKQPDENGSQRDSVIINGEYVFSPTEAVSIKPDLVPNTIEEYDKIYFYNQEEYDIANSLITRDNCLFYDKNFIVGKICQK